MSYEGFRKTFLVETPQHLEGSNDFYAQLDMIKENLKYNSEVTEVVTDVFKTQHGNQTTYWMGDSEAIEVSSIVDTETNGEFCRVVLTSKNPNIPRGVGPYVSDLYLIIKNDVKPNHLVFTSDEILSTDGEKLWKGLVNRGHQVSVYDKLSHKYVLSSIANSEELESYIGDADKRRFVFVLSEDLSYQRGVITKFSIMEIKRLAGWSLF
jgi:hypothetical protein